MKFLNAAATLLAFSIAVSPAHAEDLAVPTGDILLVVSGTISNTNGDGVARFDRAMLEDLPTVQFTTTTIWTEGPQSFTGVALADLMATVGASGTQVQATAINDYAVEIPMEDATEGRAVIAYLRNGEPMSVRDKGPLWVVYNFDNNPEFQTEVMYARSIWQLDRIAVE